ncbi:MAG: mechanosensitive ion channel family protein [Marinilabiliales bacterium]
MDINWSKIRIYVLIFGTIFAAFFLSFILRKILNIFIKRSSGKINSDPTNFYFIKNSISFIIYTIAVIYIFYNVPALKSIGTALFAGAGVLAAIIGFASQKAFANIIGGIFILIFKPFRVGDVVEIFNNKKGIVEEITLRHTIIKDYENRRIIIPNDSINDETIINSTITDSKIRKFIDIGISYDSDIDHAIAIIKDEVKKHPLHIIPDVEQEKEDVIVRVIELGDFAVKLRAYIWAKDNDDAFSMSCQLLKSIKERFDNEGIEIPFPYRTIVYKKDIS